MTTYQRSKAGITYFSEKEVEIPESKINQLKKMNLSPAVYEAALKELHAHADSGEELKPNVENLALIAGTYNTLSPAANDTRAAQVSMTVELLNETGADLEAIKKAAGASWSVIRNWVDEPAPSAGPGEKQKKSGKVRVPKVVVDYIEARMAEDKAKHDERMAAAAEKKNKAA